MEEGRNDVGRDNDVVEDNLAMSSGFRAGGVVLA